MHVLDMVHMWVYRWSER